MNEEISNLIDLQSVDSEIDGFDRAIEEKQLEVTAREQAIADKENKISQCLEKTEELGQRQLEMNEGLEGAKTRIKESQNKMMQVQTSREHQALLKEIEDNKKLIKNHEEQILSIMEQIEQLKNEAEELENLCKGERKLLVDGQKNVEEAVKKINSRKKTILSKREEITPKLRPTTLKRYTMLRDKRNGNAVVLTVNGVCQGCFMAIPPQQFNEVRKGDKLNFCPTCQRILYFEEEAETTDA